MGSLVMGPHTQNLHGALILQYLVDEPVLQVDPAGVRTRKIADELFVRGRVLKGILAQNREQRFCLGTEPRGREFSSVPLRLPGENNTPGGAYHPGASSH